MAPSYEVPGEPPSGKCRTRTPAFPGHLAVAGLCAAMALLFALALFVPFLCDFYEPAPLSGEILLAWAVGAALAAVGMLGAVRLFDRQGRSRKGG